MKKVKTSFLLVAILLASFTQSNAQELIHYWHFNSLPSGNIVAPVEADSSVSATKPAIVYRSYAESGATSNMDDVSDGSDINTRLGEFAGKGLRPRDPADSMELFIQLPTTGHDNIVLSYATQRSGSGWLRQIVAYTLNGTDFIELSDTFHVQTAFTKAEFDFRNIAGAENNPDFAIRIRFDGQTSGGNNRFDNIVLESVPVSTAGLIHYWNFNDNSSESALLTPTSALVPTPSVTHISGGASVVSYTNGTGQDFNVENLNARNGDTAGTHLRFNNPIGGALEFALPTTGYDNIVVKFATRRSGSGAGLQYWSYTTDGSAYIPFDTLTIIDGNPVLETLNFSALTDVNNNANFKLKVEFAQGDGGTAGNNRFDNFTVESIEPDLSGAVTGVSVSPKELTIQAGTDTALTATVSPSDATDPSVAWSSSDVAVATVDNDGKVTAVAAGNATIYVTTNDGGFMDSASVIVTEPSGLDLIYYWHFNTLNTPEDITEIEADFTLLNGVTGKFEYTDPISGERDIDRYASGTLLNVQQGAAAGAAARVRNPSENRSLVFDVPATKVKDIVLTYAVQRSGQGMLKNIIEYSSDGTTFTSAGLTENTKDVEGDEVWQIFSFDFSSIAAVNDNPNFKIKITWEGNTIASNGNNRYDNITVMGVADPNISVNPVSLANPVVTVFPNPSNGHVSIQTASNKAVDAVSVIDVSGRVVMETKENSLDMTALQNGVYFIMTVVDGITYKNKLVLNK